MTQASLPRIPKSDASAPSSASVARAAIRTRPLEGVIKGWNVAACLAGIGAVASAIICMASLNSGLDVATPWFGHALSASLGCLAFRTIAAYLQFQTDQVEASVMPQTNRREI